MQVDIHLKGISALCRSHPHLKTKCNCETYFVNHIVMSMYVFVGFLPKWREQCIGASWRVMIRMQCYISDYKAVVFPLCLHTGLHQSTKAPHNNRLHINLIWIYNGWSSLQVWSCEIGLIPRVRVKQKHRKYIFKTCLHVPSLGHIVCQSLISCSSRWYYSVNMRFTEFDAFAPV